MCLQGLQAVPTTSKDCNAPLVNYGGLISCRLTLSQFNPLLEEVAFIREGGRLMTSIAPEGGKIPAESGQVTNPASAAQRCAAHRICSCLIVLHGGG